MQIIPFLKELSTTIQDNPVIVTSVSTIVAALLGAIVGAFFAYRTAIKTMRTQDQNKAASDFRMAFMPEILYLEHNVCISEASASTDNLCEFLRGAYVDRHLKAIHTFRAHLNQRDRKNFDRACEDYCYYRIDGDPDNKPFFEQYYEKTWEGQPTKDLALQRINRIIKFAE